MDWTKLPYVEEDNTRKKNYFLLSGYAILLILLIGVMFGGASVVDDSQPDMRMNVSLSDDEIPVRNSVEISVDIINNGGAADSVGTLELQKDGEQIMTEEIGEIGAGETKTISHEQEFEENGSFTISALSRNGSELEDSETLTVRGDSYYADMIENELERKAIDVDTVRLEGETIYVSFNLTAFNAGVTSEELLSIAAAYEVAMDEGWNGMSRMEVSDGVFDLVWEVKPSWIESWQNDEIDDGDLVTRIINTTKRSN